MSIPERITIIGTGGGGLGFALDLIRRGVDVVLYTHEEYQTSRKMIEEQGGLIATGELKMKKRVTTVTDANSAALHSSWFIIMLRPDIYESTWLKFKNIDLSKHSGLFAPSVFSDEVLPPYINFGRTYHTLSTPISTVRHTYGIEVRGYKKSLPILGDDDGDGRSLVKAILGMQVTDAYNSVDLSTRNPSGVFHPLLIMGNAERIKRKEQFLLYPEGLTAEVIAAINLVYEIPTRIRIKLKMRTLKAVDTVNEIYLTNYDTIEQFRDGSDIHRDVYSPDSLRTRMFVEDVRVHWVPWCQIGELLGVDVAPLRERILEASELAGEDFFKTGFNLERLGFTGLTAQEFIQRYQQCK